MSISRFPAAARMHASFSDASNCLGLRDEELLAELTDDFLGETVMREEDEDDEEERGAAVSVTSGAELLEEAEEGACGGR